MIAILLDDEIQPIYRTNRIRDIIGIFAVFKYVIRDRSRGFRVLHT